MWNFFHYFLVFLQPLIFLHVTVNIIKCLVTYNVQTKTQSLGSTLDTIYILIESLIFHSINVGDVCFS